MARSTIYCRADAPRANRPCNGVLLVRRTDKPPFRGPVEVTCDSCGATYTLQLGPL